MTEISVKLSIEEALKKEIELNNIYIKSESNGLVLAVEGWGEPSDTRVR